MYTSLDKLVEFYFNNTTNLRPLISAHYVISYPQNGDRIVTIDTATSLHPLYWYLSNRFRYETWLIKINNS